MGFFSRRPRPRVLFIGLDGTPHPLLARLAADGTMPNARRLLDGAIFRKMSSSIPDVSSTAWSTMMTGKNPGEHGIYGFTELRRGSYSLTVNTLRDLKAEPFWAGLNRRGKRTVVINMPSTYPAPDAIDGLLVSGFVAVDLEKATVPRSLVPRLREMGYRVDVDARLAHEDMDRFIADLHETHRRRADLFRWAVDNEPWDFFGLIVTGTDRLHHFLWPAIEDPAHPRRGDFLGYYRKVDDLIGEAAEKLGPQDRLLMMSDHGFCGVQRQANVCAFLRERGFLKFARPSPESPEDIAEGTTALAMDPARIYLHREGRYPRGKVREADGPRLLDEVEAALRSWSFEGRPVIAQVHRGGAVYRGPCLPEAPDLVAIAHRGFDLKASVRAAEVFSKGPFTGMHTQDDAFLLARGLSTPVPEDPNVADVRALIDGDLA